MTILTLARGRAPAGHARAPWWASAAALGTMLVGCSPSSSAPPGDRPNVVLVTIDTLRPDRLGCYGYDRDTSPNIDRFAEQCLRFVDAHSTSSFTPPSHASILTSRYPGDHGLLTWNRMEDAAVTLTEVLHDAGYRTGASTNLGLLSKQNLGQGFAWGREAKGIERRRAREIVNDGLEFIDASSPDQPFFLWLHFYDVHRPYGGSPKYKSHFRPDRADAVGDPQTHYNLTSEDVGKTGLSSDDLAFIEDRYDAGIKFVDERLGPLLDKLSAPPYRDDTLVVVTADHGEVLQERYPFFCHDPFLFRAVTQVPMLVRLPGREYAGAESSGVVDGVLVSLIDVAPTVLDVVGIDAPPSFAGTSLLAAAQGKWTRDELYMENWGWVTTKAVRTGESLVIHDVLAGDTRYYDLTSDPAEFSPSLEPRNDRERELGARLLDFTRREGVSIESPSLAGETVEQLRELGYAE